MALIPSGGAGFADQKAVVREARFVGATFQITGCGHMRRVKASRRGPGETGRGVAGLAQQFYIDPSPAVHAGKVAIGPNWGQLDAFCRELLCYILWYVAGHVCGDDRTSGHSSTGRTHGGVTIRNGNIDPLAGRSQLHRGWTRSHVGQIPESTWLVATDPSQVRVGLWADSDVVRAAQQVCDLELLRYGTERILASAGFLAMGYDKKPRAQGSGTDRADEQRGDVRGLMDGVRDLVGCPCLQ